ncbi:MAG: F0F1 ATP synthase subunit epsilon [Ignavibacteria bacterium]|nr:F0F1 ATP synthase subunit epsilon [Ignavibacteria bacterium]
MFDKPFQLQIVTPARVAYKDTAVSISAPGVRGGFQVLYNHAPFLSALEIGELKVMKKDGSEIRFATGGGFLEVKDNAVVVLADSVENASDIDVERARDAKERAAGRMQSKDASVDVERARLAMLRALNRLKIAGRS